MRNFKQEKKTVLWTVTQPINRENWYQDLGVLDLRLVLTTFYQEYPLSCTTLLDAHLLPQESQISMYRDRC